MVVMPDKLLDEVTAQLDTQRQSMTESISIHTFTPDQQFTMTVTNDKLKNETSNGLKGYPAPDGNMISNVVDITEGSYVVKAISINDPDWVCLDNNGNSLWVRIGDPDNEGRVDIEPASNADRDKLGKAITYSYYDFYASDIINSLDSSVTLNDVTDMATYGNVPSADSRKPEEIVVNYTPTTNGMENLYEHYLLLAAKAYGAPPQWTQFVDPRIYSLQASTSNSFLLGRRYLETVIAAPTILSLCPGVIKYNSMLGNILANSDGSEENIVEQAQDVLEDASGKIIEFEPCWYSTVRGNNYGYLKYVNLLNKVTAIAMSREKINDDSNAPLSERTFPVGYNATLYKDYDWRYWDEKDNDVSRLFSNAKTFGGFVDNLQNFLTTGGLSSVVEYKYINFYCSGNNSMKENFETSVRSSSIEDLINSNLTSVIKDFAYMTGGVFGADVTEDLTTWAQDTSARLGPLGNLVSMATEVFEGGRLIFPQVVDDCTFGRECQFTVRFVAGSANCESRFLMRNEFNHLLAFVLPRQVAGNIDMYTTPFLVRGLCKGLWNCEIGVVTGFQVTYGGTDDSAWTIDSQPTEIEATFSITPLYSKLVMSSMDELTTIFLRNTGLMEYIIVNCGVDLRLNQFDMKMELIKGLGKGFFGQIPDTIEEGVWNNKVTNAIRSFVSF